jgi:2-oxoisovalerate dehydrogenase E1 component alpha subunit
MLESAGNRPWTGGIAVAQKVKEQAGSRHEQLGLSEQDLLEMYRTMLVARLCDEAQFRLNRQGKAPFVVPVSGHEGCQIGTAWAFRKGRDVFVPYYRDMGICLVAGMTPRDVFLGVFGKREDPSSGGRQMPAHWGSKALGIPTGSSPIATQIPHAAGIAYAIKYRDEDAIVGCWFGDGATSEGDWHEGLNFSGIHKLPVVWYCENNKYAISVPLSKQMAVKNVAERASAYGFEGVIVDGNDVLACYEASKAAVDRARSGGGPTLVELKTYRFHPHTSDDDDRTYRSREEVEEAKRNDPILLFGNYLKEIGLLDDEKIEALRTEVKDGVDADVEAAWNAEDPTPESALLHVFASPNGSRAVPQTQGGVGRTTAGEGRGTGPGDDSILETTGGEAAPATEPAGSGEEG